MRKAQCIFINIYCINRICKTQLPGVLNVCDARRVIYPCLCLLMYIQRTHRCNIDYISLYAMPVAPYILVSPCMHERTRLTLTQNILAQIPTQISIQISTENAIANLNPTQILTRILSQFLTQISTQLNLISTHTSTQFKYQVKRQRQNNASYVS